MVIIVRIRIILFLFLYHHLYALFHCMSWCFCCCCVIPEKRRKHLCCGLQIQSNLYKWLYVSLCVCVCFCFQMDLPLSSIQVNDIIYLTIPFARQFIFALLLPASAIPHFSIIRLNYTLTVNCCLFSNCNIRCFFILYFLSLYLSRVMRASAFKHVLAS